MPMPMKPLRNTALLFVAVMALTSAIHAQDQVPARNRPLIAMIDKFMVAPFDEDLRVAIADSAEARPDVTVSISTDFVPFICYGDKSESVKALDALLLVGFVGGNMRHQLRTGVDEDQPEAGMLGALEVYATIKAKVPNYYVPEVDEWQKAKEAGTLGELAEKLSKVKNPKCKNKKARFGAKAELRPASPG
jgi:hypothetical protein